MKVQNVNRSSQKTRELIRRTFAELAAEKGYLDKMSVTELVKRADINRATFYTHYSDIYEIADEYQKEVLNKITLCIPTTKKDVIKFLDDVFEFIHAKEDTYRLLLTSDDPRYFLKRVGVKMSGKILSVPEINRQDNKWIAMKVEMYVDGVLEQIINYFRGRSTYSFEEMKEGLLVFAEEIL